MHIRIPLIVILVAAALSFGCGGSNTNSNANTQAGPGNAANSDNPTITTGSTPEPVTNNAPTLTPVVKAYCDAWAKNDEAALRKIFSKDTLAIFDKDMKEEKETSFIKYMDSDRISGTPCEARNEKIDGDRATVIIVANKYPNGYTFPFVKENGEWKMTNQYVNLGTTNGSNSNSSANTSK